MSELTEYIRENFPDDETTDPKLFLLCDAHEALEAELAVSKKHGVLDVMRERDESRTALFRTQDELRRLEGLLRAWGSARKAKTPGHVSNEVFWAEDAVYAEAVRLAREPHP